MIDARATVEICWSPNGWLVIAGNFRVCPVKRKWVKAGEELRTFMSRVEAINGLRQAEEGL